MLDTFMFSVQTQLCYGAGWSRNIPKLLNDNGYRNIVILVDEGVVNYSPYFGEIKEIISNYAESLFVEVLRGSEEPDYDYLDLVAEKIRTIKELDVLIGIGGGSCLDITKAVAVLKTNAGRGIDYRGFDNVLNPGVSTIAIPTTAGTGSEVTINAVFTDKQEKKKLGINGRFMHATYAVLDAEWTMSCPQTVAISSGMDAMTHTLESYMCVKANLLTRSFSQQAFRLLYNALPTLVDSPGNIEKRQELLLGSYLAAIALFNSGSGISGALSYPLGVHFKVPHGIGGGIFLASVVEYNVQHGYHDYAALLDLIELHPDWSLTQKSIRFSKIMRELSEKLLVPEYLDQWGITKNNLEDVERLMLPLQAAFDQNPVFFSAGKDVIDMLRRHTA